jgi:hypothetical protein
MTSYLSVYKEFPDSAESFTNLNEPACTEGVGGVGCHRSTNLSTASVDKTGSRPRTASPALDPHHNRCPGDSITTSLAFRIKGLSQALYPMPQPN